MKLMKYDAGKDEYQVIADLSAMAKLHPSLNTQISDAEKRKTRPVGPGGPGDVEKAKDLPKHEPSPSR